MKSLVFYRLIRLVSQVNIVHLHTVANKRKSKFYAVNIFTVPRTVNEGHPCPTRFSVGKESWKKFEKIHIVS